MAAVLVIDDDELVRQTVRAILLAAGHSVATAANGRDGIDTLERRKFELVVTDILMPEQEGLETIRQIRRRDRSVGILAMSGGNPGGGIDFFAAALVFGADATLPKPFTRQQMVDSVDAVLAQRRVRAGEE